MRIIKYTYVDVYWSKGEETKAKEQRKRLEKLGYNLEVEDDGSGDFDYCDQYLRYTLRSKN